MFGIFLPKPIQNRFLSLLKLINHDISKVGWPILFQRAKSIEKNVEKRKVMTQPIEGSFLIDPLTTDNAIYRDSLAQHFLKILYFGSGVNNK